MLKYQCPEGTCKNRARFFVSQSTVPQRLADGSMETSPAARSSLSCGTHLVHTITTLGMLPFRTDEPVRVSLQKI